MKGTVKETENVRSETQSRNCFQTDEEQMVDDKQMHSKLGGDWFWVERNRQWANRLYDGIFR
eukprot:3356901-Heterocapsa_arctica.AAC.1